MVQYSRDAAHRLTQVQYQLEDGTVKTFGFAYDALGRRSQASLANGITIGYTWDAASQLTGITYRRADGSVLGDLTYVYDPAGRRTSMGGSLAKTDLPQAVGDAQYNGANQLTRWAGRSLTYDANGNLTSDGENQYGWDIQDQLLQLTRSGGAWSATYMYDMDGQRNWARINGEQTDYYWTGGDLVLANTGNDWAHRTRQFSLFGEGAADEFLFRRIGDDARQDRYPLRDANNNVIALTDAAQQIVTRYTYEPYGRTTVSGAADTNPQQYTARENDGTGLYYYRNRYYDPNTTRFISEDPIGWASGQTNAYAYVNGNPVQFNDPFGLGPWDNL